MNAYEVEHIEKLRKYAPECTVLLKQDGRFPLKTPGKVALYGNGARRTIKGGTGSGDVNSRFYVTVEQGLIEAGAEITTTSWMDAYDKIAEDAHVAFIKDIKKRAKEQHVPALFLGMGMVMPEPDFDLPMEGEGDTAIYVLARNSGEGSDRKDEKGDFRLTDTEVRDILKANEKYDNFMLVLNVGGPLDLTPVKDVKNILILSQLGVVTGSVLADIMYGKAYPSGRLASTWSAYEDYCKVGTFAQVQDVDYEEGIYVGYRYFDTVGKMPMYPFGYGLGFTTFSMGKASAKAEGSKISLQVPVENIGECAGKEVVQVYVSVPEGKLDQPYQVLAGFAKTKELGAGERQQVEISFDVKDLASYDEETSSYILEKGNYIVRVGKNSKDTQVAAVVVLGETVTLRTLSPVGGKPHFEDWKPEKTELETLIKQDTPVLMIEADAFLNLSYPEEYQVSDKAKEFVAGLTDEEALKLCIGNYAEKNSVLSVIGSASMSVAGAAGETRNHLKDLPVLVMADGPAGVRISKEYTKDSKGGVHSIGSTLPADMIDLLPGFATFMMKLFDKKPKGNVLNQYCTAIPIGTALAQSFDLDFVETCGDMVGREMEMFDIDLWLAPAFNIHRSPLCGRNFEYYSEDPFVSGMVATAMTKGVQKHPGRGVTVKHFCGNNQETNRYASSSNMSERALREIYMKGFEICVREAKPWAIMTSYNLINGIHASEREDIMKGVVRKEWGYSGLIMTDWVIAGMGEGACEYRPAKSAPVLKAGNDLFMPGTKADFELAYKALTDENSEFKLTREEMRYCAEHIADVIYRMKQA